MAEPVGLSRKEAARLGWMAQFHGSAVPDAPRRRDPATSASGSLSRIGWAQIDTISVVERAHHHVLWSRDRAYRPLVLAELEREPRLAFEYWAHAAAYLPMEDYRYCLPRMKRIAAQGHEWFPTDDRVVGWVRDRIRAEGPLRSQDFQSDGARGPWWDWKPAKAALEFLFQSGELMVASRPGFQKLYDLSERVLPSGTDTRFPTDGEMADWYVGRAARGLGVFTRRDVAYMRKDALGGIKEALARAVESKLLLEAAVEDGAKARAATRSWVSADLYGLSSRTVATRLAKRPVRILSPFDNLVIDRARCLRVTGLDYTIECYVPAAKRVFGYFALPVFWKGLPVGLLDCKAERKQGVVRVRRSEFRFSAMMGLPYDRGEPVAMVGLEAAERAGLAPAGFSAAFHEELSAYAAFNGCAGTVG